MVRRPVENLSQPDEEKRMTGSQFPWFAGNSCLSLVFRISECSCSHPFNGGRAAYDLLDSLRARELTPIPASFANRLSVPVTAGKLSVTEYSRRCLFF